MKRVISLILCFVTLLALVSCADITKGELKKYKGDGITLYMSEGFEEVEDTGYNAFYILGDVYAWAIKDNFAYLDGSEHWTLDYYAWHILDINASKSPKLADDVGKLTVMEYTVFNESKKKTFTYFTAMFKTHDAFWMVQFACEDVDYDEYKPYFAKWANEVEFSK